MNGETGLSCPQCNTARDIYRYCMNCGLDFGEVHDPGEPRSHRPKHAAYALSSSTEAEPIARPPAPVRPRHIATTTDTDTDERPAVSIQPVRPTQPVLPPPAPDNNVTGGNQLVGGSSAPIGLGLVAASVCVLLLVIAAMVSLLGEQNEPAANASGATSDTSADKLPAPSTLARCWNDQLATAIRECPVPTRTAGLAWVFPSFDRANCTNRTGGRKQPESWTCPVRVSGGGEAQIYYRQLKYVDRARANYDRRYGAKTRISVLSPREDVERYVWRTKRADNNGVWSVASMYAKYPWSVTVTGTSSDDVESAFKYEVEFRNPRRIIGRPAQQ
jgi:hypothetical protein